jgi:acyl carrier protein
MSAHAAATRLLADALMITERDVPPGARLGQVEQWDSLAHARLLMALEEKLGRQLTTDEAVAIETLDDIARLLEAKR